MKKIYYSLLLFFFSCFAWADNVSTSFTDNTAMNNHRDLSVSYLGQIFGSVGNSLHGMSGQMLGKLFYKLNAGVIIVAGIWLAYTVITIVLRSTMEGSFMGQNKNVALAFLKIAFGFALLVPNPTTGYSLLQDTVMRIVVAGAGLADQTWEYGLDYVNAGGTLWRQPQNSDNGNVISDQTAFQILGQPGKPVSQTAPQPSANNAPGPVSTLPPIQQIFADEVCMYSSRDYQVQQNNNSNADNIGPAVTPNSDTQDYSVYENDQANRFQFPGTGGGAHESNVACGAVSWNINSSCASSNANPGSGQRPFNTCVFSKQAVSELVTTLEPAAKQYYCSLNTGSSSCVLSNTDVASGNEEMFFGALLNYANNIVPLIQSNSRSADGQKSFINEAQNEGWVSAGRYYWDLSQVESHYQQVTSMSSYVPAVNIPTVSNSTTPAKNYTTALTAANGYVTPAFNKLAGYRQSQQSGTADGGNANLGGGDAPTFAKEMLDNLTLGLTGLFNMFQHVGSDPIVFLHNLGMKAIQVAGDIWIGGVTIAATMLLSSMVCTAQVDMQGVIAGVIEWIKPLFVAMAGLLWASGFLLAYYVPMYPYFIYIFGVIGWIIAVIEAMVAAPLVCFGLTHPEGHDMLGEAKQALMLLLGIFLRPTLMVIGMIAGMILSYVALHIVIYSLTGFLTDLFAGPSSGMASGNVLSTASAFSNRVISNNGFGGFVAGVMAFPLVMVVFTMMIYTVTTYAFSLIYMLPDYVMRWIGMAPQQSPAKEMAQQLQSPISQLGSKSGETVGGGLSKTADRFNKWASDRRDRDRLDVDA